MDIRVVLRCPACRYQWADSLYDPDVKWYAAGLTPAKCAKTAYCPKCDLPPPMDVVDDP